MKLPPAQRPLMDRSAGEFASPARASLERGRHPAAGVRMIHGMNAATHGKKRVTMKKMGVWGVLLAAALVATLAPARARSAEPKADPRLAKRFAIEVRGAPA